jgi:uncharacterized membrane protein
MGRLHPLLVHFPIALVIAAAAAEAVAAALNDIRWRAVAVVNVRAGAAFAVAAVVAGWRLAAEGMDSTTLFEWHRWLGVVAAGVAIAAAAATAGVGCQPSGRIRIYQAALFGAAVLVAVTGHVGGLLVWGADFLRP